jgi:hypothetical protein
LIIVAPVLELRSRGTAEAFDVSGAKSEPIRAHEQAPYALPSY